MNDKELLEFAAKAANIEKPDFIDDDGSFVYHDQSDRDCETTTKWNPLKDDGDALRMAVKLGLHITPSESDCWATHIKVTAIEPLSHDSYCATRRAIVRAAAEIGESL